MTQDELKQAVAQAAADHVARVAPAGSIIGVGTGSTANFFIDALAPLKDRYRGAVARDVYKRQGARANKSASSRGRWRARNDRGRHISGC